MPDDENPFKRTHGSEVFNVPSRKSVKIDARLTRIRRVMLAERGVWLTARLDEVKIADMKDDHLRRVLLRLDKKEPPFTIPALAARMAKPLLAEKARRDQKPLGDRFSLIELD